MPLLLLMLHVQLQLQPISRRWQRFEFSRFSLCCHTKCKFYLTRTTTTAEAVAATTATAGTETTTATTESQRLSVGQRAQPLLCSLPQAASAFYIPLPSPSPLPPPVALFDELLLLLLLALSGAGSAAVILCALLCCTTSVNLSSDPCRALPPSSRLFYCH